MLLGLRTVSLHVSDLEAATRWYSRIFGFGPYFKEPFYVGFDVEGFEFGLHPIEGEFSQGNAQNWYWGVEDVETTLAQLRKEGATLYEHPQDVGGGIIVATVKDPFGNLMGLIKNPHFCLSAAQAGGTAQKGPVAVLDRGGTLATLQVPERQIVVEQAFSASPATLWNCWTREMGWLVDRARIELRIGGPYELLFDLDQPVGLQGSEGCRILSFLPQRMLSFTWNAPPSLPNTRSHYTWVVLEFLSEGAQTRLRLTHTGWPEEWTEESSWPATFAYFDRAWPRVFKALEKFLESHEEPPAPPPH